MNSHKNFKNIFILILILFFFGEVKSQETFAFFEAHGVSASAGNKYDFEKWDFSAENFRYEINKNGKSVRIDEKNRSFDFSIKLENNENLVRIYIIQYKNDLVLLCEVESADAGSGFITRLDGKTLRTIWRENIPGFNVAKGLIEGNMAYLGAIGFAAKINLDTGKYIWQHDNFYRKYKEDGAFNIFQTPELEKRLVIYTENQVEYNRSPNTIKFDKENGKIIEVKVN